MSGRWEHSPWCTKVRHGVDGWSLEEMEWDPDSGVAVFRYHNSDGRVTTEFRPQPTREGHLYWEVISLAPYRVLSL